MRYFEVSSNNVSFPSFENVGQRKSSISMIIWGVEVIDIYGISNLVANTFSGKSCIWCVTRWDESTSASSSSFPCHHNEMQIRSKLEPSKLSKQALCRKCYSCKVVSSKMTGIFSQQKYDLQRKMRSKTTGNQELFSIIILLLGQMSSYRNNH